MQETKDLLRHFLGALAYRTQKAIRGCSPSFPSFRVSPEVRSPHELVHHMDSVLGYARTFFGGSAKRNELQSASTNPTVPILRRAAQLYGTLGSVVLFLIWVYLTSWILLLGGLLMSRPHGVRVRQG